jgi:hypothetical protein
MAEASRKFWDKHSWDDETSVIAEALGDADDWDQSYCDGVEPVGRGPSYWKLAKLIKQALVEYRGDENP